MPIVLILGGNIVDVATKNGDNRRSQLFDLLAAALVDVVVDAVALVDLILLDPQK